LVYTWFIQYRNAETEKLVGSSSVASRRDMFTPPAILYGTIITTSVVMYTVYVKQKHPLAFLRQGRAFFVMFFFALIWNIAQFTYNLRWIEVDNVDDTSTLRWKRASLTVEIFCFAYDIVVEIAVFYMPFYAIPWAYGGIRDGSGFDNDKSIHVSPCVSGRSRHASWRWDKFQTDHFPKK